jgi:HK97 family phage portal protein
MVTMRELVTRTKQFFAPSRSQTPLAAVDDRHHGGWFRIHEPYAGAWQTNVHIDRDSILAQSTVFACITLIASDLAKLRPKLVEQDANGIWMEIQSAAFSPVLKKPNTYQNHIQFKEWWAISKLIHGNTYALKQRDERNVVVAEYLLDPCRVTPLVSESGAVFYQLKIDHLSGLQDEIVVPAREVIHDRMNCLFHPLVGISPLFAAGLAATQALRMQGSSAVFFGNNSLPGGILTAPGPISNVAAADMKTRWEENYSGSNAGKIAVLGDGLKFEAMTIPASTAQLIEQLKWSAETVCSCFHVPPFKVGIGPVPPYQNAEVLNTIYYTDCLQKYVEDYELCHDEGLGLTEVPGKTYGVELDIEGLLRMDTATQIDTLTKGIGGALFTPNEARLKVDKKPLEGGNTIYMQQQEYSLAALAKRDQRPDPFAKTPTPPAPAPVPAAESSEEERAFFRRAIESELTRRTYAQSA